MMLPVVYGGSGGGYVTWVLCQEELARASAAVAHTQLL
jgi:alkylation response protein AidB-like acyl-CoA dehydrogenase